MTGINIRIKIINAGKYVLIISFEILYFIKNIIVNAKKRNIPSDLIVVHNDTKINEKIIPFLLYFKKNTSAVVLSKIKSGSVIPNNEFKIIRGSKINIDAPISDNL
tara:strand:- start:32 stop:349 length:318 start_codon:yes stop_codon:yes gene_type:complete